ncbi:hypothetical protein D3C76_1652810 [compost metagenome]
MHDRREHILGLRLLRGVRLREHHAGAQNAVLMKIVGQRIKHRAAVMGARANQRHFAAKIDALLDDTFAVAVVRQLGDFVLA